MPTIHRQYDTSSNVRRVTLQTEPYVDSLTDTARVVGQDAIGFQYQIDLTVLPPGVVLSSLQQGQDWIVEKRASPSYRLLFFCGELGLATGPANGDLDGSFPNPTVVGLNGYPIANVVPASGQVLGFQGSSNPGTGLNSGDGGGVWVPITFSGGGGGAQGPQGPQGNDGAQGPQGDIGPQGYQGYQGYQGFQGAQGIQGSGSQGVQGSQGYQGNQGRSFLNVTSTTSVTLNGGIDGTSVTFATPYTGAYLAAYGGQEWVYVYNNAGVSLYGQITALSLDTSITVLVYSHSGTGTYGAYWTFSLASSPGSAGATGPQGAQGYQGLTGPQGSQGSQGTTGAQGNQGFQGYQGTQGSQGVQGYQGAQGSQGYQGTTGAQGTQGVQGTQGYQGNQGVQGAQGSQGTQGYQGNQGTQGLQGYQGTTGAQGNQGVQGSQGNQGSQGSTGPQGNQGTQGLQGYQGTTGAQGAQGFQGNQGQQGFQGNQGYQGTTGSQGAGGTLGYYGSFYDTTTQSVGSANTPTAMTFNTTAENNGVSITSSSQILFANAGTYNVQFSAQLTQTDNSSDNVQIWLRKNGSDLTETNTTVTMDKQNSDKVASWNFVLTVAANDYLQLMWESNSTSVTLLAQSAGSTYPATPSVILTVQQVMYTQLGPQGPQGLQAYSFVNPLTVSGGSTVLVSGNGAITTGNITNTNLLTTSGAVVQNNLAVSGTITNISGFQYFPILASGTDAKTTTYQVQASDNGKIILASGGTITLVSGAPAPPWYIGIANYAQFTTTVNPNGIKLNGNNANYTLVTNQSAIIYSDGAGGYGLVTAPSSQNNVLTSQLNVTGVVSTGGAITSGGRWVYTGSSSGQILTLGAVTNGTMTSLTNLASVPVTLSGASTTINTFGTTGSLVVPPNTSYTFFYTTTGSTWYATASSPAPGTINGNLTVSGNVTVSGTLTMGNTKVTGLASGTALTDAVNVSQIYSSMQAAALTPVISGTTAIAETVGRIFLNSSLSPASGAVRINAVYLTAGQVIHNISFNTTATAGTTVSGTWGGIFTASGTTVTLVAATAQQGLSSLPATSLFTWPIATIAAGLSSTYTVPSSGLYYIGVCITATTMPTMSAINGTAYNNIQPPIGFTFTGSTNPAAIGTTYTGTAATLTFYYVLA